MENRPWYLSSANSENLSLTVKGLLSALIPGVVLMAQFLGVDLGSAELNSLADNVSAVIVTFGALVSTLVTVYGAGRKVYYKFRNRV